jgi:hypothetical protein
VGFAPSFVFVAYRKIPATQFPGGKRAPYPNLQQFADDNRPAIWVLCLFRTLPMNEDHADCPRGLDQKTSRTEDAGKIEKADEHRRRPRKPEGSRVQSSLFLNAHLPISGQMAKLLHT